MKKVLLVVALLLFATTAFAADVTITANVSSTAVNPTEPNKLFPVTVGFTGLADDNSVTGFALVLTVDSGMNLDNIRDFNRGESKTHGGGYGIFPGKFRDVVNPATPDPCFLDGRYDPIAPWNDANSQGGEDNARMVVELGAVWLGDANKPANGGRGTLFTVDVNAEGKTDCNMCIQLEQTRGGVVKYDATAATVTLPGTAGCFKVTSGPGPVVCPNVIGMSRTAAMTAITGAGLTVGTETNVPPTTTFTTVRTVTAQNPAPGYSAPPPYSVAFSAVSYPVKDLAPNTLYANWVNRNRPQCWAYPRQCRGDADGKKLGTLWVSGNDLTILKGAISKAETYFNAGNVVTGVSGICADFDHKKLGTLWVSGNDLTILKAYISKAEASIPICGSIPSIPSADANYWYYCLPAAGVCPAGQQCAPAAICPNTP